MRPAITRRVTTVAFLVLLTALVAEAEQAGKVYRIGAVHNAWAPDHPALVGLKAGLRDMGLEEGRRVSFHIEFTRGDVQALPAAAAALVQRGVDLIFTTNEAATEAARAATDKIPIVFSLVGDPIAAGFVKSFGHPGGNVTGVSILDTELTPKRLEVLRAFLADGSRVWVIYYAHDKQSAAAARKAQEAAARQKLQVLVRPVATAQELTRTLRAVQRGDGLLAPITAALDIQGQVLETAAAALVPAVFPARLWASSGALVSYGADYEAAGRQAARLAAKILDGAEPRDLPVEGANRIELVINFKAAKALRLTIPSSLLLRADHVIE